MIASIDVNSPHTELMQVVFDNCLNPYSSVARCRRAAKICLKTLTFGCAIGGAVPNIPVALKFGGKNFALGVSVACANFVTRTFLVSWAFHHMIDGEIGRAGRVRSLLSGKKNNLCKRIAIKVTVFVIAFVAQTPRALIAYRYNNENILHPILTYQAQVAVPALSMDLSCNAALKMRNLTLFENQLNKVRKDVLKQIQICKSKIEDLSAAERELLVGNLAILLNRQTPEEVVSSFFSKVCAEKALPPKSTTLCQKVKGIASRVFSGITALTTTAAQTGFYFWVGVKGSQSVWDNPYFCYSVGTVILISNLYLTTKVMINGSRLLFNQAFFKPKQILTGHSACSILMPKARAATGLVALGLATLSSTTMVQNVRDYVSEGPLASILKVLVPLSMFIIGHKAISDLLDEIFNQAMLWKRSGTEFENNLLILDQALNNFNFAIETMSLKNFGKLLKTLPDDVFSNFAKKIKRNELETYLTT